MEGRVGLPRAGVSFPGVLNLINDFLAALEIATSKGYPYQSKAWLGGAPNVGGGVLVGAGPVNVEKP
ncbi:hypothetical protein CAPI_03780 [Corynebacterium capitovis DSM 44611]|nr:hypothetical protein CAPI_03780 [Corynebacterium capitovis DSM 44611]